MEDIASSSHSRIKCRRLARAPSLSSRNSASISLHHLFYISFLLFPVISVADSHSGTHSNGPRPPRIKEHPSSSVVKKHEPVKLTCKADGEPKPTIEWYRDNELVQESSNHIYLDESLFILKVMNHKREKDTGVYYCLAKNAHGKARSHNATIEIASIRDEFRTLPKSVQLAAGDQALFECSPPRGYPEPVIQWKKDGELVSLNSGGRFRLTGTDLLVTDVQPEDAGRYQCIAQNMGGSRESPPAQLIVRVKPYFIRKPEDVTAQSNEDAEIHCKVGGDPPPKVTWRREGGKMPAGRTVITEDKSIRIASVSEEDEGLYICEADNLAGKVSSAARLIVHSRPDFLVQPKDVRANINGVAKFDCVASGNPRPSVFWTKEGNQFLMFPDNKYYGRFSVSSDGSLVISPVKKEDRGYYVCSALSVVGSNTAKAHLNISSVTDSPPPIIVLGLADQTLPEHTTAMLPCDAIGSPHPSLKWLVNNSPLSVNNPRFTILESGTLRIDDLQTLDSGEYRCLVYSDNGETSWSAHLKVVGQHSTNTMFHRMPDPSTYPDAPSRPAIVNVTDNSVTISWRRIGRDGSSPFKGAIVEYFSPDHNNEWIRAATNVVEDTYTVNALKSGSRYFFLVRIQNSHGIGAPGPISYEAKTLGDISTSLLTSRADPVEVRRKIEKVIVELKDVQAINSSSVKLHWNVKGSQEFVEGFYVRYRVIDPNNTLIGYEDKYNMVKVYNGGASSYVLHNLPRYSTFEFFLVPFYNTIDGRPSNTRIVRTLDSTPSAPPTSIKARPINSNSALVTWQPPPPHQTNGQLLGYHLYVHGSYIPYTVNLTINENTTSFLLRNLSSETEYVIQLCAFTSTGVGALSPPLTFIMDPYLSSDVYEDNTAAIFDTSNMSNVWICVLIISLIILSLIVLLLGFLLYKKGTQFLNNKNNNSPINREHKPHTVPFYSRQYELQKSWDSSRFQTDLKPNSMNSIHKMSPPLQTDNHGYSMVGSEEQADYAEVSPTENNYETAYYATSDPRDHAPVAYASSSIISGAAAGSHFKPANQHFQWGTQANFKSPNVFKPNFSATLDRNHLNNVNFHDTRFKKPFVFSEIGNNQTGKNSHALSAFSKQAQPLIGSHFNDYEDASLYYADSAAYGGGGGNVTQIPSSKLMANQLKYGSLSRINHKGQPSDTSKSSLAMNENFLKKKAMRQEWESSNESPFMNHTPPSSMDGSVSRSHIFRDMDYGKNYGKNSHIISNPLADGKVNFASLYGDKLNENCGVGFKSINNHNNHYKDKSTPAAAFNRQHESTNNTLTSCDTESAYQELS